ncbi:Lrp/AsnC ligand binding domain-containing protein, partial [Sinorhizobium meliloti]
FSPGHRDLHRIFANPTESQLAEITQFFLRQPLRKAREIIECHMVIGGFDYLVKARIADMAMFQEFLQRVILPLTGVRETHTYASIGDVKPDALLPL